MQTKELIKKILFERRPSITSIITAQDVLRGLMQWYVEASKSFMYNLFNNFQQTGLAQLIIFETNKQLPTNQIITNIINNVLTGAIPVLLEKDDVINSLLSEFLYYYPGFIKQLPAQLRERYSPTPFYFLLDFEKGEISRHLSSSEGCAYLQAVYHAIPNNILNQYFKKLLDVENEQWNSNEEWHIKRITPQLATLNTLVSVIDTQAHEASFTKRIVPLMKKPECARYYDALILLITNFIIQNGSLLNADTLYDLLLQTYQHKKENLTLTMIKLISLCKEDAKIRLSEMLKADILQADKKVKCFGIKALGLLEPYNSVETKELLNTTREKNSEFGLVADEVSLTAVSALTPRLELFSPIEITRLSTFTIEVIAGEPKLAAMACETLMAFINHISTTQKFFIMDELTKAVSTRIDTITAIAIINLALEIVKDTDDAPLRNQGILFAKYLAINPHLLTHASIPKALAEFAILYQKEMSNDFIPSILDKVKQGENHAATYIILLQPLLDPQALQNITNILLNFYLDPASKEKRLPASRILGSFHHYIEEDWKRRIIVPLHNRMIDSHCEDKDAIALLDNLSPLISDDLRQALLKMTVPKLPNPNADKFMKVLLKGLHDNENNHYFQPYLAYAKLNDKSYHSQDHDAYENLTVEVGRAIADFIVAERLTAPAPVLTVMASNRPSSVPK
jgi:hypothetical protein